jgi:SSS family solute:Na+ symporter
MNIDLFIITAYLIISVALGLFSTKKTHTSREYIIGSKDFPTFFLFATITATCIGGGSTVSHAAEVVKIGILITLANMGQICDKLITANILVPKMERFLNKLTVGEILEDYYGKPARVITGICGALFSTAVLAAQIKALSFLIGYFLPVSNTVATISSCAVFIFYSAIGGIRAVTITDVLQFVALAITIPMVLNVGFYKVGGVGGLLEKIPPNHINIFADLNLLAKYSLVFLFFSVPCFDPAIMQRVLMGKDIHQIRTAFNLSAAFDLPFYLIAGIIGLVAVALAPDIAPNRAFLYLVDNILPVGIKGFAITGMLAVVMSTADSYLNVTSAYIVHDIVRPFKRLSDDQELSLMKWATIFIGIFAVSLALAFESIYELVMFSYNFWAPIVVVPLIVTILGYNCGKLPFYTGAIAGMTNFILWEIYGLPGKLGIDSIVPNMLVNLIVFSLTWYFTKGSGSAQTKVSYS